MCPDPSSADPSNTIRRLGVSLPTRSDEAVMALLVVVACSIGFVTLALWKPLVDIDEIQPQQVPFKIDLDTASWPEFTLIPGIGEKLAKRIVESRESQGSFEGSQELLRVRGIGPVMLEQIQPYLLGRALETRQMSEANTVSP